MSTRSPAEPPSRDPPSDAFRPADEVVKEIHAALERESRVRLHQYPIKIEYTRGVAILDGEVRDIAAKKLALERAAAVVGVRGVVDRLRIAPAEQLGDGAMRDWLSRALLAQGEFNACSIDVLSKAEPRSVRTVSPPTAGHVYIEVHNGMIVLDGTVPSLAHKRLAGVLAWWTPGCRDVVNSLAVEPPEDDTDDEVLDAFRLVLEVDPLLQPEQVTATCRDYVVTLDGYVRTEEERHRAEDDAWALFAVNKVVNRIRVRA